MLRQVRIEAREGGAALPFREAAAAPLECGSAAPALAQTATCHQTVTAKLASPSNSRAGRNSQGKAAAMPAHSTNGATPFGVRERSSRFGTNRDLPPNRHGEAGFAEQQPCWADLPGKAAAPLPHSTNGATPLWSAGDCFGFPPAEQAPPNWVWPERHSPRQSGSKLPHSHKRSQAKRQLRCRTPKAARASRKLPFRFNEMRDLARGVRDACFHKLLPCNTLRDGAMGTPLPITQVRSGSYAADSKNGDARASRGLAFRFNEIRDLARGVGDACFRNPLSCNTLRDGAMGTPPPPSRKFGAEATLPHPRTATRGHRAVCPCDSTRCGIEREACAMPLWANRFSATRYAMARWVPPPPSRKFRFKEIEFNLRRANDEHHSR